MEKDHHGFAIWESAASGFLGLFVKLFYRYCTGFQMFWTESYNISKIITFGFPQKKPGEKGSQSGLISLRRERQLKK